MFSFLEIMLAVKVKLLTTPIGKTGFTTGCEKITTAFSMNVSFYIISYYSMTIWL